MDETMRLVSSHDASLLSACKDESAEGTKSKEGSITELLKC